MAGLKVEINGAESIVKNLQQIKNEDRLVNAIKKACEVVKGRAKLRCPVDEGRLRNSIDTLSVKTEGNKVTGRVGTSVEYAAFVEFGTGSKGSGTYPYPTQVNLSYTDKSWTYTPDGGETFYKTNGHVAQPFLMPALLESKSSINKIVSEAMASGAKKG